MTRWIRFEHAGTIGFGTLTDDTIAVYDGNMFDDPTATGVTLRRDQVTPATPTTAGKMLALWNNSRAMAAKLNQSIPREPLYFIKASSSYLGTDHTIRKPPSYDGKVVFEGELGVVIGKECRAVSTVESDDYIFGYTCINDVTAIGIIGKERVVSAVDPGQELRHVRRLRSRGGDRARPAAVVRTHDLEQPGASALRGE